MYNWHKVSLNQEWQARQREKTKELHRMRQEEEDEEEIKIDEYREIGLRLKDYPEEEVRKVKKLVSSFIRSAEEVEEVIMCFKTNFFIRYSYSKSLRATPRVAW